MTNLEPLFYITDKNNGNKFYIMYDKNNAYVCGYKPADGDTPLPMATLEYAIINEVLHVIIDTEIVDVKLPKNIVQQLKEYCGQI